MPNPDLEIRGESGGGGQSSRPLVKGTQSPTKKNFFGTSDLSLVQK